MRKCELSFPQPVKMINIKEAEDELVSGVQFCDGPPSYKILGQAVFDGSESDRRQSNKAVWTGQALADGELILGIHGIVDRVPTG